VHTCALSYQLQPGFDAYQQMHRLTNTAQRRYLSQIGLRSWFSTYCGGASCYGTPAVSPPVCTHKCGSKVCAAIQLSSESMPCGLSSDHCLAIS